VPANGFGVGNYVDLDGDVFVGDCDFRGRNDLSTFGATATAKWQLGGMELTGITDEDYLVQTFDVSGTLANGGLFGMIEQYYDRPRTWTATLRYEF